MSRRNGQGIGWSSRKVQGKRQVTEGRCRGRVKGQKERQGKGQVTEVKCRLRVNGQMEGAGEEGRNTEKRQGK